MRNHSSYRSNAVGWALPTDALNQLDTKFGNDSSHTETRSGLETPAKKGPQISSAGVHVGPAPAGLSEYPPSRVNRLCESALHGFLAEKLGLTAAANQCIRYVELDGPMAFSRTKPIDLVLSSSGEPRGFFLVKSVCGNQMREDKVRERIRPSLLAGLAKWPDLIGGVIVIDFSELTGPRRGPEIAAPLSLERTAQEIGTFLSVARVASPPETPRAFSIPVYRVDGVEVWQLAHRLGLVTEAERPHLCEVTPPAGLLRSAPSKIPVHFSLAQPFVRGAAIDKSSLALCGDNLKLAEQIQGDGQGIFRERLKSALRSLLRETLPVLPEHVVTFCHINWPENYFRDFSAIVSWKRGEPQQFVQIKGAGSEVTHREAMQEDVAVVQHRWWNSWGSLVVIPADSKDSSEKLSIAELLSELRRPRSPGKVSTLTVDPNAVVKLALSRKLIEPIEAEYGRVIHDLQRGHSIASQHGKI